ncbi:MAG: hypothetical protein ACI8RZ_003773 [Myxococcota bacterium]|jgi:hypothetical protein
MNLPTYALNDQPGQPVVRQLSDEHAAHQPALDAWLAAEYWPCRARLQADLAGTPPWLDDLTAFVVPLVEVHVAVEWLRFMLLDAGVPVLTVERLATRYVEVTRGAGIWGIAAWVLSEVQAGHCDALLAEPPPNSCTITRVDGVLTFTLYFGQRLVLTHPIGSSR